MRPPDKKRGPEPGRDQAGAESRETGSLTTDHSKVIRLPRDKWQIAMQRAHAIRHHRPGTPKIRAVGRWRIAVWDALGQEVR